MIGLVWFTAGAVVVALIAAVHADLTSRRARKAHRAASSQRLRALQEARAAVESAELQCAQARAQGAALRKALAPLGEGELVREARS